MKTFILYLISLISASAHYPSPSPTAMIDVNDGDSICVKYTKALYGEDTADNELALVQAVVTLAVVGDTDLGVPGILAPQSGLAEYFDGTLRTTNRGGDDGVAVNFLDGAADLPNPDPSSNTSILLVHLNQFFGSLLGCSAAGFPACKWL